METQIVRFDPQTASRDAWAAYHRFRRARHEEHDPGDPLLDDAAVEVLLSRPDPTADATRFAALAPEGGFAGFLEVEVFKPGTPDEARNPDLAWFGLEILAPHRGRGIGRGLLARAEAIARRRGKGVLGTWTDEHSGIGFLKRLDGRFVQRRRENRLRLADVEWDLLLRWVEEGAARSPDTRLRWFGNRVDDDVLPEFAEAFTEVFNEQPFGDMAFRGLTFTPELVREHEARIRESGGLSRIVVSQEPDGAISALTELTYHPTRRTMIGQGLTGVRSPYRGRGLGKWVKAAMLLRVREEFPDVAVVVTGNASSNEAMLSINERMGFRLHREAWVVDLSREGVERYLESRGARLPEA
jgi:GNAT superfamily N-acetyltransferase